MKRKNLSIRLVDYVLVGSVRSIIEVFTTKVVLWVVEINLLY